MLSYSNLTNNNAYLFNDIDNIILGGYAGDVFVGKDQNKSLTRQNYRDVVDNILTSKCATITQRVFVCFPDENIDYEIPQEHIVADGLSYNEQFNAPQRRNAQVKLIDVVDENGVHIYRPHVDRLWYGTRIKIYIGYLCDGIEYLFLKGVFIIDGFDQTLSTQDKFINYTLSDKFKLFEGSTGVIDTGYEVPVQTPVAEVIDSILNMVGTDGVAFDLKPCLIDNKFENFITQQTIRIEAGGNLGEILTQLATQLSAELFYNSAGCLCFYPIDESGNDSTKPILWEYDDVSINQLQITNTEEIVNCILVQGTNVDNSIYTGVARIENYASPINIYRIKERREAPITDASVWTDDMAQELAEYYLRAKAMMQMVQSITVPFNPLLMVNNVIQITNKELGLEQEQFIIQSISYQSNTGLMQLGIANLNCLPVFTRKGA